MTNISRFIAIALIMLSLTSCKDILLCSIDSFPKLPEKSFNEACVNTKYSEKLYFEDPKYKDTDNDYYIYDLGDVGILPKGIYCTLYDTDKSITFDGTPSEKGSFTFTVNLKIKHVTKGLGDDEDEICNSTASHSYTIVVK